MNKGFLGRIALIIGLVLVIGSMMLTTVAPNLISAPVYEPPPATPEAASHAQPSVVFPTPPPGTPVVDVAGIYVHPSAAFYMLHPQGWTATATTQEDIASVSLVNGALYSVVHAYIQRYTFDQTVSSLDALNDAAALAASWAEYDGWAETDRQALADRLVIDFRLELAANTYLARHITWPAPADHTWAMVLRLVAPGNNPALLDRLEALIIPSYDLLPDSLAAPLPWRGYVDHESGFSLKYPDGWAVVDGGVGRTTTLASADGSASLTVSGDADAVLDGPDAAGEWVRQGRPGATVVDVAAVERAAGSGYSVAYTFADADGEGRSGLAVLLNGPDGRLLTATLRLNVAGVNLLAGEAEGQWSEALQALATFAPLPDAVREAVTVTQ